MYKSLNPIVPGKGMRNPSLLKLLKVMKLVTILITVVCLQVSAYSLAQNVTIHVKNAPLTQVFKLLTAQTGMEFLVNPAVVEEVTPVTMNVQNESATVVLVHLLDERGLKYEIRNNIIIVTRAPQPLPVKSNPAEPPVLVVKGRVTDMTGTGLPGASVQVKGTRKGTQTDVNGYFSIKVDKTDLNLVITYTGFGVKEARVAAGERIWTIMLQPSTSELDQVQIIGYGQTTKRFNTSDVTSVKAEDIQKSPVSNVLAALEGRVPGLVITQNTGMPGGSFKVNIRGINSLTNQAAQPLFVIDGVPYPTGNLPLINQYLQGGSYLNYLNSSDIESVDVLKDADATAIYGSRGSNGVVLITTKKGKAGKTQVNVNAYSGFSYAATLPKLLNLQQYLEMRHEAKRNDGTPIGLADYDINGTWDTTRYTDWQKIFMSKKAYVNDVEASVSGGANNTIFSLGGGYHKQTSIQPGDGADQRASVNFSTTTTTNNHKLSVTVSGNYSYTFNDILPYDFSNTQTLAPDAPKIFNADGSLNWENNTFPNPFSELALRYKSSTNNLVSNGIISYKPVKGLELKATLGYANTQISEFIGTPLSYYSPASLATGTALNQGQYNTIGNNTWSVEPQANYNITLGKGTLSALAGVTFQSSNALNVQLTGKGYSNDALLENQHAANTLVQNGYTASTYRYNAAFGRLNYNWDNKYLLNLTGRYDGSSRFGPGDQFHFFGAVGAGWIFTEEAFIKEALPFLSFGKLRGSYGTTGSDQIGDYSFYDLYIPSASYFYGGTQGLAPSSLYNPTLHWELNRKSEVGLELGFLRDRISVEGNYYINSCSNQLVGYQLPRITGFPSVLRNSPATIQNKGMEFSLRTMNINGKNFKWSTSFNISANHNKLTAFPNLANTPYATLWSIGQSPAIIKLFNYAGVDPKTGVYTFYDAKGNITTSPNTTTDKTAIVDPTPKYFGGFSNTFQYKGFSLDVLFSFISRDGQNDFSGQSPLPPGFASNVTTDVLSRWQKPGDVTDVRSYTASILGLLAQSNALASTRAYSDATFARLQNLSLSYQLPHQLMEKWKVTAMRVYLQGQNLLTISSYKNLDPENLSATRLPPLRQITAGFQITL